MNNFYDDARSLTITASDEELFAAVEAGNIPTLQLVLAQLTGDDGWLTGEYTPSRTRALNDNDTGGFDEATRATIRAAVVRTVAAIRDGELVLAAPPSDDVLITMLSRSLGEEVPSEYGPLLAEEGAFRARTALAWREGRPEAADKMHVLVIGAGFSGIATAVWLEKMGIPFTIVEKKSDVGGVWRDNVYPGAGVDTPAHLYSFSFAPWNWSKYYAKQPEVLTYARQVADRFGITERILFDTEVGQLRWNDNAGVWDVDVRRGDGSSDTLTANVVVTCVGTLTEPSVPRFPGAQSFTGPQFHSARWVDGLDVTGKKVAIIGTGATAMQIVPAIADDAAHTTVFQRTPQWIAPNINYLRTVDDNVRFLIDQVPYYGTFYRQRLIWQFQDKLLATLRRDPDWPHQDRAVNAQNDRHREFLTKAMLEQLGPDTEAMREVVIPTYPPYSKRILMDNEWIGSIRRDDVSLVPNAVKAMDETGLVDDSGCHHDADIIVYATGFEVRKVLATVDVVGRDGTTIRDAWGDDDASAYLGMAVPNFPNFFVIGGPQTIPAHGGSALFMTECSIAYIVGAIVKMVEQDLKSIEVTDEAYEDYNRRVDAEHESLVWSHPGTNNWYRNSRGRVISALPWRGADYREMTETPDFGDYRVVPATRHAEQLI